MISSNSRFAGASLLLVPAVEPIGYAETADPAKFSLIFCDENTIKR